MTEQLAEEHKMPSGIYVADVDPDSPAMAAGIQIGDIICGASGEEIKDIAAYQNIVIGSSVGETMEFVGKRLGSDGYVNIKFSVVTTEKKKVNKRSGNEKIRKEEVWLRSRNEKIRKEEVQ